MLREPLLLALGGRLGGLLCWLCLRFSHCYASLLRLCPRFPRKGPRSGASSTRGDPRDLCPSVDGPAPPTLLALPEPCSGRHPPSRARRFAWLRFDLLNAVA